MTGSPVRVLLVDGQALVRGGLRAILDAEEGVEVVAEAADGVLALTTFDLDEYVFAALRAGASGFLLKSSDPADLAAAVRACCSGELLFAPTVTRRLVEAYVSRPLTFEGVPEPLQSLTEQELDVLRVITRGLSNAEIAGELCLGEATVRSHVTRILAKLNLRDRVQAVVLAYESGLVTPGPERRTAGGST